MAVRANQVEQRQAELAAESAKRKPMSWAMALLTMALIASVLWIVALLNTHQRFNSYGLRPRRLDGLQGIVLAPFLHTSFGALLSLSAPFVLLGWAVLISGARLWLIVTALIIVLWGALTWALAPAGVIVGVSGLTAGWMGYLLARAYFSRRALWILGAVFAAVIFSGVFAALIPAVGDSAAQASPTRLAAPWQANLCGFVAGIAVGWLFHPPSRRGAIGVTGRRQGPNGTAKGES